MRKILLVGNLGQVGYELQRSLSSLGQVIGVDRNELDITDISKLKDFVRELKPQVIVNAAAYTAVDRAESEASLAKKINADAPTILAEEAKRLDACLIHYSTDYVFDGTKDGLYSEDDIPNPLGIYGQTKLDGELGIQHTDCDHLTFRTSWVYGSRGQNFLLTMLRLSQEKEFLKIVNDQVGAPTWSRFLADATAQILAITLSQKEEIRQNLWGTYHLTSQKHTTWYDFTRAIIEEGKHSLQFTKAAMLSPITTEEYPTPAKRPKNSKLDLSKVQKTFGIYPPQWNVSLKMCVEEIAQKKSS